MTFLTNIIPGYKCKFIPPQSSKCGGVAVFYKQNYKVEIKHDLKINSDALDIIDVDELWIDAETDSGFQSTIGVI